MLVVSKAPAIENILQDYMKHIISFFSSSSPQVKLRILQGIVSITDMNIDMILLPDNFVSLAELMFTSLQNKDD
jgi:hypothetical protein